ncbi:MAG: AmmeMemoRadiSam system protein B [Candidatus Heimdallarchaeota archaeon]|nr:AmmeMemoRadiSam system protein B [Candidatus Heimdallarchaeota archaeon]
MLREPAVAGSFYPGTKKELIKMIERCFEDKTIGPGELPDKTTIPTRIGKIYGLVSPHAGFVYSGPVAAHGYLEQYKDGKPEFFVIIGPNHRNLGPPISVYPGGKWKTPLGEATIPIEIVEKITKQPHFRADTSAHMLEHSIEVQVPFLQYIHGEDVPIIPICLKDQSKEIIERVGTVLSKVLADYDYCMIASTDLSHYESQATAMSKDTHVIDNIRKMNYIGLYDTVMENMISMCGPGPVASVLLAAKNNNVKAVKILKYATSGDVTGDIRQVVAYLSAILLK